MPEIKYQQRNEISAPLQPQIIVVETDSMGRNPDQIEAMEKNDPRPPRIGRRHVDYARNIAVAQNEYPKVMYRYAVDENGCPCGDLIAPNYPMPYDLAQANNLLERGFKVVGQTASNRGYIEVRHPYQTHFVPIDWDPAHPKVIDVQQCRKDEVEMVKAGWVRNISDIPELPRPEVDKGFDPLKPFTPPKRKESPLAPIKPKKEVA